MIDPEKQKLEQRPAAPETEVSTPEAFEETLTPEVVETSVESEGSVEEMETGKGRQGEKEVATTTAPTTPIPTDFPEPKDPIIQEVESILEEDLKDMYQSMNPKQQAEFRARGEEVATAIGKMIHDGKIVIRKVVKLIRGWLALIPGVNKFFLEQEAKIKTDKIVLASEEVQRRNLR